VTRTIHGNTDKCAVRFDTVSGSDRIPVLRMHFILTGRSMRRPTAGKLILTIIHDLPVTFIFPAPNCLVSKRLSRSTNDRKDMPKVAFDLTQVFGVEWR
jgi:hypothetical protein